jgi:hypothetical protein
MSMSEIEYETRPSTRVYGVTRMLCPLQAVGHPFISLEQPRGLKFRVTLIQKPLPAWFSSSFFVCVIVQLSFHHAPAR